MAVLKLRGQSYPIQNIGMLGSKIEGLFKKITTPNVLTTPSDDALIAYCISQSCPTIPPHIASWKGESDFICGVDEYEFTLFYRAFALALLEKKLSETTDSTQRGILIQSIKQVENESADLEIKMNQALSDIFLTQLEGKEAIAISPENKKTLRQTLVDAAPELIREQVSDRGISAGYYTSSGDDVSDNAPAMLPLIHVVTNEEDQWVKEQLAARRAAKSVEAVIE